VAPSRSLERVHVVYLFKSGAIGVWISISALQYPCASSSRCHEIYYLLFNFSHVTSFPQCHDAVARDPKYRYQV
jgi:hypothetical protein